MQTAVITGANAGLGFECARALLARDGSWHVVLAVRDPGRGREAVQRLGEPARCTVMTADLASLDSVRGFVAGYREADLPPTRALVCNAGIQVVSGTRTTADGIELTFGVNHLGHFCLVQGLLDRLDPPARIVVVSSDTHDPEQSTGMPAPRYESADALADPAADSGESPLTLGRRRYTTSKLCNVLFAYELDRRLAQQGHTGVSVNAFNPGLMPGSGLARDYSGVRLFAWRFVLPLLRVLPQVRSARVSGKHLAALAADPAYDGVSGRYFDGLEAIESSADSHDLDKALDLWQTSERLTRLVDLRETEN